MSEAMTYGSPKDDVSHIVELIPHHFLYEWEVVVGYT